jgi:uncharacterized protein (DUF1778 family)
MTLEQISSKLKMDRLEARLTPDRKAVIQRAADISSRSLSDFVVGSAYAAAEETIRAHDLLVLSARDSVRFVETLLQPVGPNDALSSAARRYRALLGSEE